MRQLLFFFFAAFAVSPLLTGCVGLPNPQSEWTTTEGVGDQPPVSNIQGSIDLTPLEYVDLDVDVRHHEHREHDDRQPAETKRAAAHPSAKGTETARAEKR
ncbi:MAG TPA: hypothetical protein VIF09_26045 [Polyangiaceae bacterium]|jgi:hypothetical protein